MVIYFLYLVFVFFGIMSDLNLFVEVNCVFKSKKTFTLSSAFG